MFDNELFKQFNDVSDLKEIVEIQYGIFNPELIKRGSVVHCISTDRYEHNEPKPNGIYDARMGVIENDRVCLTCKNTSKLCPGHFGHIELGMPVFYHHFVETIANILRSVCFMCSNLLADKGNVEIMKKLVELNAKKRLDYLKTIGLKTKNCSYCNYLQPKIMVEKNKTTNRKDAKSIINILAQFNKEALKDENMDTDTNLEPKFCYIILKRIKDVDIELLGFDVKYARPEWMICSVLPVPPPSMRPFVHNGNQEMADDLTHSLIQIIRYNNTLKERIVKNKEDHLIKDAFNSLQHQIAMYMNNEPTVGPVITHKSNRPLKSISQRLKGKEGRMRGNIMGKRTDFTARTVASAGVNIKISQFGVPRDIAMILTFPDIVTRNNIGFLTKLIRNGPENYPGANSIIKKMNLNGNDILGKIELKYVNRDSIKLEYGDVVNRHILEGDKMVFNRQPSLHKMSMICHDVVIFEGKTFRLNLSVTAPYNADFDGDELNAHCPQSIQTREEIAQIASVNNQIISPAKSKPIIKVVQDSVAGAFLLSMKDVVVSRGEFMNLMTLNSNFDSIIPPGELNINGVEYWTGHQLFSMVLPDITITVKNGQDEIIKIVNGIVKEGVIDANVLDQLIQPIYNIYDASKAGEFLDNIQSVLVRWMINSGFSIGFGDALPSRETIKAIEKINEKGLKEAKYKMRLLQQGLFYPDVSEEFRYNLFEVESKKIMGKIADEVGGMIKSGFEDDNVFYQSIVSGTKGKWVNAQQVLGIIGQQEIWGTRISEGFTNRTIPHFCKFDNSPYARGFCNNSFMKGLSPVEVFFHAMAGRTGVVDTAIKTSTSGYITRRLVKGCEDLVMRYDNTVRNANNKVVEYTYGDDGFDPIKLESDKIKMINYDNIKMEEMYKFDDDMDWKKVITSDALKKLKDHNNYKLGLDAEFEKLMEYREDLRHKYFSHREMDFDVSVFFPFKIRRLSEHIMSKFGLSGNHMSDLDPIYVIDEVNKLCADLVMYNTEKEFSLILLKIKIHEYLASKCVIMKYKLTRDCFDFIIETIKSKTHKAFIDPGEMVGVISAQSIGEPTTQLILNTFHFAGIGSKSVAVTKGAPRIEEIIKATDKMKTPSATIYLKEGYRFNREKAEILRAELEYTRLRDLVSKINILYDNKNTMKKPFEQYI